MKSLFVKYRPGVEFISWLINSYLQSLRTTYLWMMGGSTYIIKICGRFNWVDTYLIIR